MPRVLRSPDFTLAKELFELGQEIHVVMKATGLTQSAAAALHRKIKTAKLVAAELRALDERRRGTGRKVAHKPRFPRRFYYAADGTGTQ